MALESDLHNSIQGDDIARMFETNRLVWRKATVASLYTLSAEVYMYIILINIKEHLCNMYRQPYNHGMHHNPFPDELI